VGLFETGMYEYDAALAYISIGEAQRLLNLGQAVTGLEVKVKDFYQADQVASAIEKKLGNDFIATDWMHMHKNLFSWISLEKYAMFLALSLIVAVAAFNIVSTLVMIVLEKKKEIGILKSMGSSSASISKIFVYKGLMIGAVGSALGAGLGFLLCWIQQTFKVVSLPPDIYFINTLPIDLRVFDFILVGAAALLIALLATLYPARKAARLNPVEAIRYE
jgi:lipoprotein-releasing system permease protein